MAGNDKAITLHINGRDNTALMVRSVNTGLQSIQREAAKTSKILDAVVLNSSRTTTGLNSVSGSVLDVTKNAAPATSRLTALMLALRSVGPAATAAGAGLGVLAGVGLKTTLDAGSAEQTEIAFKTLIGSAERTKQFLKEARFLAADTPLEFPEVAGAAKKLLAFNTPIDEVTDELQRIGDVSSGVGQRLEEIADIYGRVRVQGRMYAQDVHQFTGRGIPVIQEFAKQLGVADTVVAELVSDGKIGFEQLRQAFIGMTSEGGKFHGMMSAQSKSLIGMWAKLTDDLGNISRQIGNQLLPQAKEAVGGLTELAKQVELVVRAYGDWADAIDRINNKKMAGPGSEEEQGWGAWAGEKTSNVIANSTDLAIGTKALAKKGLGYLFRGASWVAQQGQNLDDAGTQAFEGYPGGAPTNNWIRRAGKAAPGFLRGMSDYFLDSANQDFTNPTLREQLGRTRITAKKEEADQKQAEERKKAQAKEAEKREKEWADYQRKAMRAFNNVATTGSWFGQKMGDRFGGLGSAISKEFRGGFEDASKGFLKNAQGSKEARGRIEEIRKGVRTPHEVYRDEVMELEKLRKHGLDNETIVRRREELKKQRDEALKEDVNPAVKQSLAAVESRFLTHAPGQTANPEVEAKRQREKQTRELEKLNKNIEAFLKNNFRNADRADAPAQVIIATGAIA